MVLYQILSQVALFLGSLNKHSHHTDHKILARLSPIRQEPEGVHVSRLLDMLHVPHHVLTNEKPELHASDQSEARIT